MEAHSGKNQCSVIHLAAGIEWHLQKRPNRFPLKNRVIGLAAELRIHEHNRSKEMRDYHTIASNGDTVCTAIINAICRDLYKANRDSDFRFWPLFSGKEIDDHDLRIRIVDVNSHNNRTRVYNYRSDHADATPDGVLYLLAHR